MSKIIGVTVGTPISPQTIKDKLKPVLSVNGTKPDENGNVEVESVASWNDLTDKPFGEGKTEWKLADSGSASYNSAPTDNKWNIQVQLNNFKMVEGNQYKIVLKDPVTMMVRLETECVGRISTLVVGIPYHHLGTASDPINGSSAAGGASWSFRFTTYPSEIKGWIIEIYELAEAITPLNAKFLPSEVVLEDELNATLYEYANYVESLIPDAVLSVNGVTPDENGNVEVETGGVTSWNDLEDKPFGVANETVWVEVDRADNIEDSSSTLNTVAFNNLKIVDGKQYKVSIIPTDINLPAIEHICVGSIGTMMGLPYYNISNSTGSFEIYSMNNLPNWQGDFEYKYNDTTIHRVNIIIYELSETIVYLDEKYIPDTIARVEDIPEVPTKVTDLENDAGFITVEDIPEIPEFPDAVLSVNGVTPDKNGNVQVEVSGGSSGSGSPAIIDVVELPTENIREDCFYRLLTGSFVYNQFVRNDWTCHCVESLPETGDPAFAGDLSDTENVIVIAYYNVTDESVYAYVTEVLASMFGVPAGWYPVATLMQAVGFTFNGVITDITDNPRNGTFNLLLEYVNYSYKDAWTSMKAVGRSGEGISAEVFNHPTNIASGVVSHAEGYCTTASGKYSHAEGEGTTASGDTSHAEGNETIASGKYSHAEGDSTTASGNHSHAEGQNTIVSGDASHAEGGFAGAYGDFSHAEGNNTTADGACSHAEGVGTIAVGVAQHVQGSCNVVDPDYDPDNPISRACYAHIVGNGTDDDNRSNAHTLDWDGNAWFQGTIKLGGTGQDDEDAVDVLTTADIDTIATQVISKLPIYNGEVESV